MSRSRLPPTPAMSGELIIKDQPHMDGSDAFTLPPAAISPSKRDAASRRSSKSDPLTFCPASPESPELGPGGRPQPSRQTSLKRPLEDFDLPPPPTRTRKIIQMKPKTQNAPKPSTTTPKASTKETNTNKNNATNNGSQPASKKKQPSATSAAGRKIARKTAHSLIERRRRSKMNEEFSTLKDMIPACRGQDMHKLAILQASIDYVNYLETCIHDLKTAEGSKRSTTRMPPAPPSPASPEVLEDGVGSTYSASVSPELLPEGQGQYQRQGHHSNMTSPAFSPRSQAVSAAMEPLPSILPSPALGPSYLTDPRDLSRSSWTLPSSAATSPVTRPERRNASAADIDHEASAALLMLNRECRQSISSIQEEPESVRSGSGSVSVDRTHESAPASQRKRMSVMDLLIS